MTASSNGPLSGVKVLDLTSVLLGPFATQIMGDMGAEVIKIEGPDGDTTRDLGPRRSQGMSSVYLNANRNKRSLCVDLKTPEGKEILNRLIETADVFVHNMRPSAIKRLGYDYPSIQSLNPKIIYCGSYGFSQQGPYANKPAYDDMIQGVSGMSALQSKLMGRPGYVPTVIADKTTGLTVVYAISMALFNRERTDEGQEIDVPMFETMVQFVMLEHLYGRNFEPAMGDAGYPRATSANRHPYKTKDGMIGVLPYVDKQWKAFFELAGRPELMDDPRFSNIEARLDNIDAAYGILAELIATRTSAEWLEDLDAASIPAVPINTPDDLLGDEHLEAIGFWQQMDHPSEGKLNYPGIPTRFSKTPGSVRLHAPTLGEHNREILTEAGYSEADIAGLQAKSVVQTQKKSDQ